MLAPRTSSAFVCLRCELKLAQSRAPVVSRIRPRAHFSVSAHRRDAFDDALAPAKLAPINPRPLGKLRKRKGKSIRETTAPLGVKTLGNDAEIIVLRELAEEAPEEKAAATEPAPDTPEDLGILASLQEEGKKLEQSDVNQQLEKLRPKTHEHPDEPHYISLAEFVQAKKALESGFNVKQLTQYFSILTGIERSKVKRKVTEGIQGTRANPITRTDWHPGTSQLNTRLPGAGARMRDSKRRSISKRLLVDKILRDGWHLVLLEEIEAPGELEICLNRWHISVLNAGETPTILDEVGNARKAKIEIHWPDSILRITADKSSAEYAADDIQNYLANTEVEVVSLNPWRRFVPKGWSHGPKLSNWLSPQVIETVEKQSGAVIEPLDRSEVQIRAVDKSRVMEAKRLLIGMLPLEDASARVVRSQAFVVEARNCYLLPTAFQTSLGYRQKGLHLGRWSLPVLRLSDNVQPEEGEPEDAQSPPKPKGMEPILDRFRGQIIKALEPTPFLPPRKPAKGKYVVWENPTTRIYADYGHVLVPMDTVLQPSFRLSNTPFLNCLPGLAKMMHSTEERPLVGAFLEYQFVLSPHQDFNFDVPPEEHPYPKLFIRVKLRDDGKPVLRGVAIEFNESVFDAVLPDRAVDIRFQHVQRVWLKDPLDIPGIREYIEAIEANIESGARLTAPPEITIDVPRWAVQGVDDMIRYPVRNLPTTYLFLRVRHQQSISIQLHDRYSISYSSIQSGKLGENGGELRLYCPMNEEKKDQRPSCEVIKGFVETACDISDRITEASGNFILSNLRRTRWAESPRKEKRAIKFGAPWWDKFEMMRVGNVDIEDGVEDVDVEVPLDVVDSFEEDGKEDGEEDEDMGSPNYLEEFVGRGKTEVVQEGEGEAGVQIWSEEVDGESLKLAPLVRDEDMMKGLFGELENLDVRRRAELDRFRVVRQYERRRGELLGAAGT